MSVLDPALAWDVRCIYLFIKCYLIAWDEERFDGRKGAAPELADVWRGFVLPSSQGWWCDERCAFCFSSWQHHASPQCRTPRESNHI